MLIVQWLARLAGHEFQDLDIVFVPISLRHETNRAAIFFEGLAARLAELLGEVLPSAPVNPTEHFRNCASDLLHRLPLPGRRCLVVFDGLDEATGGSVDTALLPAKPNSGLRIVVSARLTALLNEDGWAQRIGWTLERASVRNISVPPLAVDGIGELIDANGLHLEHEVRSAIITSLNAATSGDPLLLQLYVKGLADLVAKGQSIGTETLAGIKPGYGAYFETWFRTQRGAWLEEKQQLDDRWKAVLAVLAIAQGPLRLIDLNEMADRVLRQSVVIDDDVINLIQRFILKDGDAGYVVAHPKLAEFLRTSFPSGGPWVARATSAFLDWGQKTIVELASGDLSPRDVSHYLLEHFVDHLSNAAAPAKDFIKLLDTGWLSAWRAYENGHHGFALDVNRAMEEVARSARNDDPEYAWQIQGALILNSLHHASTIPPELLIACFRQNVFDQTQAYRRTELMAPEGRARSLAELSAFVSPEDRAVYLTRALSLASSLRDVRARIRALAGIARNMQTGPQREAVEVQILSSHARSGNMAVFIEAAEEAASALTGERLRALLQKIIHNVRQESDWRYLDGILPLLDDEMHIQVMDLVFLHRLGLTQDGDHREREAIEYYPSGAALLVMFPYLFFTDRLKEGPRALEAARNTADDITRIIGLANVYPSIPERDRSIVADELIRAVETMKDQTLHSRIFAYTRAAAVLLPGPKGQEALESAVELALRDLHIDNFSRLGPVAPLLTGSLLTRCFNAAISAYSKDARAQALGQLAPQLSIEQLKQALIALGRMGDDLIVEVARLALVAQLRPDDREKTKAAPSKSLLESPWLREALLRAVPAQLWPEVVPNYSQILAELRVDYSADLFSRAVSDLPADRMAGSPYKCAQ